MATHTFDDIIPPSRRRESEPMSYEESGPPKSRGPRRRSRFPFVTIFIVLLIVAASIGALFYFSSAEVQVVPSTLSANVQNTFTATTSGDLPFKIITAQKVASQSVAGSGSKNVTLSASGTITVYNTQGKPQQLVANTRFATTAGLIFRIHTQVTVPGGTLTKPGTVSVKVTADKPGSTYNVGPSSFTIPGFAGTPQATAVYGRSSAAITGGASGAVPVVDAVTENHTRSALVGALGPDLVKSIQDQIPTGYVLLPGAATTTYQALTPEAATTAGQVNVKEQGTITAVIFPNGPLAKAIATASAGANYQGESVTLASTTSLVLLPSAGFPDAAASTFTFSLSGTAPLTYSIDPARIAAAVAGKARSAADVALRNYPEVNKAIIVLRPFWRQSFPDDPASIKVIIANP